MIFSLVVLSYLSYTLYEVDQSLPPNFYNVLNLNVNRFDPKDLRSNYRVLTLQYHPDKLQGLSAEEASRFQSVYLQVRQSYEVLKDTDLRNAYDRFGQGILECRHCSTERDYVVNGLGNYFSFYIGTGSIMIVLSLVGKGDFGRYWRFVALFTMASLEGMMLLRAKDPTRYILPWRTTSERIAILHQAYIAVSIAVSQIGPVLWPKQLMEMQALVNELDQITMLNFNEATVNFSTAFEPLAKDPVAAGVLQRKMEKRIVDLKLTEMDPQYAASLKRPQA
ncbi:hypothetical protein HDU76_006153 [Blyttiomyces sp. JEL0837]|nr:hypothetical protein HDU76_006153 [Blyttiomyces sp. JEL0837]